MKAWEASKAKRRKASKARRPAKGPLTSEPNGPRLVERREATRNGKPKKGLDNLGSGPKLDGRTHDNRNDAPKKKKRLARVDKVHGTVKVREPTQRKKRSDGG